MSFLVALAISAELTAFDLPADGTIRASSSDSKGKFSSMIPSGVIAREDAILQKVAPAGETVMAGEDSIPSSLAVAHSPSKISVDAQTEQLIARAYVWGWPMVYLSNLRKSLTLINQPGISGGAPVAPINRLAMLPEPVSAHFRSVSCPNPDVIYGFALLDLKKQPVVVQVPEAKERYWLYQIGDHRTDSFAELGSMYRSRPGFYLIVGPEWQGDVPEGIRQVFHAPTNLAFVIPRYYVGDQQSDDLQPILSRVSVYPLAKFDGKWRTRNWSKLKWYPALGETNRARCKSVNPQTFFEDLANVIDEVPALAGEEAFYGEIRALLDRQQSDPHFANWLRAKGVALETESMEPRFDFRKIGKQLSTQWTTVDNGAQFGTDFETRAAVAKSNIFVNRPNEAKYFYLEQDSGGQLLDGRQTYRLTFKKEDLPPNDGFWSLTAYDADHRLVHHPAKSPATSSIVGSSFNLIRGSDGSITILVGQQPPEERDQANWLPAPEGSFALYLRVYSPATSVVDGHWLPPEAVVVDHSGATNNLIILTSANAE